MVLADFGDSPSGTVSSRSLRGTYSTTLTQFAQKLPEPHQTIRSDSNDAGGAPAYPPALLVKVVFVL